MTRQELHAKIRDTLFAIDAKEIYPIDGEKIIREARKSLKDASSTKVDDFENELSEYLSNLSDISVYHIQTIEGFSLSDSHDRHWQSVVELFSRERVDRLTKELVLHKIDELLNKFNLVKLISKVDESTVARPNIKYEVMTFTVDFNEADAKLTYQEEKDLKKQQQLEKQREASRKHNAKHREEEKRKKFIELAKEQINNASSLEELESLDLPEEVNKDFFARKIDLISSENAKDILAELKNINNLKSSDYSGRKSELVRIKKKMNDLYFKDKLNDKDLDLLEAYIMSSFQTPLIDSVKDAQYMDVVKAINRALEEYEAKGYQGCLVRMSKTIVKVTLGFKHEIDEQDAILAKVKEALLTVFETADLSFAETNLLLSGQFEIKPTFAVTESTKSEERNWKRNEEEYEQRKAKEQEELKKRVAEEEAQKEKLRVEEEAKSLVTQYRQKMAKADAEKLDTLFDEVEGLFDESKLTEEQFDLLQHTYEEAKDILKMRPADESLKAKAKYEPLLKKVTSGSDITRYERAISDMFADHKISKAAFDYLKSLIKEARERLLKNDSIVLDIKPRKGEKKQDFISRFMSATEKEYPDQKQRLAVAYSYWNRRVKDAVELEYDEDKETFNMDDDAICEYFYDNVDYPEDIDVESQIDVDDFRDEGRLIADEPEVEFDGEGVSFSIKYYDPDDQLNSVWVSAYVDLFEVDLDLAKACIKLERQIEKKMSRL